MPANGRWDLIRRLKVKLGTEDEGGCIHVAKLLLYIAPGTQSVTAPNLHKHFQRQTVRHCIQINARRVLQQSVRHGWVLQTI